MRSLITRGAAATLALCALALIAALWAPSQALAGSPDEEDDIRALNQIYQVLRVGPHILTATQGGAALWRPEQVAAPVAVARAGICAYAVTRSGQAWVGCNDKLLHYDGAAFSVLASTSPDDAEGYRPILTPDGDVVVYRADSAWRVQGRALVPLHAAPADVGAYHSLIRANGERWAVDLMEGLRTPRGYWRVGSVEYPGRDPRRLYEDASGRLWVEDFERGAFVLKEDGAAFVHQEGLETRCAGVAPDEGRGRLWLLHYREGLRLVSGGEVAARVDLSELGYMRALALDPDGSLWVAGWGQLAHVTERLDGTWQVQAYVVRSLPSAAP
jgi:hypothetical protein